MLYWVVTLECRGAVYFVWVRREVLLQVAFLVLVSVVDRVSLAFSLWGRLNLLARLAEDYRAILFDRLTIPD